MARHSSKTVYVQLLLCILTALTFALSVRSTVAQEQLLSSSEESDGIIRSLQVLRKMGKESIDRRVELEGTVTFVDSVWKFMFIENNGQAVFVRDVNTVGLAFGDRVQVAGTCEDGDLSPNIVAEKVTRLAGGDGPTPKPVSIAALNNGDDDCAYVTFECTVKRAVSSTGHTLYFCEQDGRSFHVSYVASTTLDKLWESVGATIQVEGVLGVTLESGTENYDFDSPFRVVKSIRVQCAEKPKILSPGRQETLAPLLNTEFDSLPDSGPFLLDGQVTHRLKDQFLLTDSPFKYLIEFEGVHGFSISNVVRVGGMIDSDSEGKVLNALAVEALFTTNLQTPFEFQTIDPDKRLWEYVKASGRPTNVRKEGGTIKFEIENDGETARIELRDDGSTSMELLRNTQTIEIEGTVMSCDDNGDCVIAVPGSRHVMPGEPIVPVWKYVAWFLIPLTAVFVPSFFWVKSQRNRAAAQSASINEMHTRLVSAFKAISDGMLAVDNDQLVLSVNSAFCKFIDQDLSPGEKVSASTFEKFLSQVKSPDAIRDCLLNQGSGSQGAIEVLAMAADGKNIAKTFDLSATPIEAPSSTPDTTTESAKIKQPTIGHLFILRDKTSERQLQAELIHANKIEAIGQLVGGIAHDFNNILTTITANLSLVDERSKLDQGVHERISDAEVAVKRGTDLVRRLLTYSGKTQLNPLPHSINETIRELYKFAAATFDARYVFQFDLDESDPFVQADAGSIEQVILNLYLNARDAMPNGGVITTRTKSIAEGNRAAVKIWVSDNGPGISPEIEKQIFNPFFTTKAGHAGAGLGLSISRRLVAEQNGELDLQSVNGSYANRKGGCFVITLPSIERPNEGKETDGVKESAAIGLSATNADHRKTVLVVDDEDAIRKVCTLILNNEGFNVVTANSGDRALAILEKDNKGIDVVLLDMTMPGISGLEVLKIASELYSNIPIVLCSGYLAGASSVHDDIQFKLSKPFANDQLVNTINQALSFELA